MLEHVEQRGAGSRNPTSEMERIVASAVVSREPITESQCTGLVRIIAALIRKRYELSVKASEQAVDPIIRRLLRVTPDPVHGTRRGA